MRESYERIRVGTKEIMDILMKKLIEEDAFDGVDPELAVLLIKCFNLLKTYDTFTMAFIETMESQQKKLDRILDTFNRREAP